MNQQNAASTGITIFMGFMSLVYFGLGLMLMVRPSVLGPYSEFGPLLGGVMMVYGLFRGYRAWVQFKAARNERRIR